MILSNLEQHKRMSDVSDIFLSYKTHGPHLTCAKIYFFHTQSVSWPEILAGVPQYSPIKILAWSTKWDYPDKPYELIYLRHTSTRLTIFMVFLLSFIEWADSYPWKRHHWNPSPQAMLYLCWDPGASFQGYWSAEAACLRNIQLEQVGLFAGRTAGPQT